MQKRELKSAHRNCCVAKKWQRVFKEHVWRFAMVECALAFRSLGGLPSARLWRFSFCEICDCSCLSLDSRFQCSWRSITLVENRNLVADMSSKHCGFWVLSIQSAETIFLTCIFLFCSASLTW
jgi:hypothetical protein